MFDLFLFTASVTSVLIYDRRTCESTNNLQIIQGLCIGPDFRRDQPHRNGKAQQVGEARDHLRIGHVFCKGEEDLHPRMERGRG